jgi:hypothetical protein
MKAAMASQAQAKAQANYYNWLKDQQILAANAFQDPLGQPAGGGVPAPLPAPNDPYGDGAGVGGDSSSLFV